MGANQAFDINEPKIKKEEILAPAGKNRFLQSRFVYGQTRGLPGGNFCGIDVHHDHAMLGTFLGDYRHRRPAHMTGSDAEKGSQLNPP